MKKCSKCGFENNNENQFCGKCGTSLCIDKNDNAVCNILWGQVRILTAFGDSAFKLPRFIRLRNTWWRWRKVATFQLLLFTVLFCHLHGSLLSITLFGCIVTVKPFPFHKRQSPPPNNISGGLGFIVVWKSLTATVYVSAWILLCF